MRYLPTDKDQEWLLHELAELIRARGSDAFLRSPIVRPTSAFFPDRVDSLPAALDRITRRLLQYAGVGQLDMRLELSELDFAMSPEGTHCQAIVGCFFGIQDGCCHFGVNRHLDPDPELLAGIMAHEVAHAYRAFHKLASVEREKEELLTDVTAVYLGFGVLSVNNSYRFRKSGHVSGAMAYTSWSTSTTGYLPPQAQSYLLGSQIVARGLESADRKAIYRDLETNQAAFVKAAVNLFESEEIVLEAVLVLPPGNPPPPTALSDVLRPLSPYIPRDESRGAEQDPHREWNRGRPVFRIHESKVAAFAAFDSLALGVGGFLLSAVFFQSWLGFIPFAIIGAIHGIRRGQPTHRDVCSDADCRVALSLGLTHCPNCGGEIMGHIASEHDRLEMEEKVRRARRQSGSRSRDPDV
jgi:hypothetical protein